MILPRDFYNRPTLEVARDLIGRTLVHRARGERCAGRIVEVEAYIGEDDPACHVRGPTRRNRPLYGPPGRAYVYLNYGIHYLVNAVTEPEGLPAAVLIRALEPVEGLPLMRQRRGRSRRTADPDAALVDLDLCRGPGNLSRALGVSLLHNRLDLCGARLFIEEGAAIPQARIAWSTRIGIRVGVDRVWRCYDGESRAVSSSRREKGEEGREKERGKEEV